MKKIGTLLWQHGTIALLCISMIPMSACSTSWISDGEQIVAALLPATANLITLVASLQGKTISAADLQIISTAGSQTEADLQLVQSLITQYKTADAAAQPGLLSKIAADIATTKSQLNSILPALHITDAATQAKISAVVGLLLSELASIEAIVPIVNPSSSAAMVKLATRQALKSPPLAAKDFLKSYNAIMAAKTGNAALDKAAKGCKIKGQGFFASLGTGIGEAEFGR